MELNSNDKAKLMEKSFPFLGGGMGSGQAMGLGSPVSPVVAPASPPVPDLQQVPMKPKRTVGNIYSAVQAQGIYNPGQATPPDPSTGATNTGPIGNNPGNQTIKGPAGAQVDQGVAGALGPKSGWGG